MPAGILFFFFFNDTATTEIYTLSLHDALPISPLSTGSMGIRWTAVQVTPSVEVLITISSARQFVSKRQSAQTRSEEHTSELQSRSDLVCRLLLEKKKTISCHILHLASILRAQA